MKMKKLVVITAIVYVLSAPAIAQQITANGRPIVRRSAATVTIWRKTEIARALGIDL